MLASAGCASITVCDRRGILYPGREGMDPSKEELARLTNPEGGAGSLHDAIAGADVFVGVSGPDIVGEDDIRAMAKDPIVFALSNPNPEIRHELAIKHARVVATGRSDYPNQVNNALCFPGLFRGVLDVRARLINEEMKLAAAKAIAATVGKNELSEEYVIPSIFNRSVARNVAREVARAAQRTGVARRTRARREASF
jgi:malate dehydrogenase (oxaloacetate-decarboxylating)